MPIGSKVAKSKGKKTVSKTASGVQSEESLELQPPGQVVIAERIAFVTGSMGVTKAMVEKFEFFRADVGFNIPVDVTGMHEDAMLSIMTDRAKVGIAWAEGILGEILEDNANILKQPLPPYP